MFGCYGNTPEDRHFENMLMNSASQYDHTDGDEPICEGCCEIERHCECDDWGDNE